ncbi:MAG: DEAD/DEAH box helicase [Pirellulales bacterium]
MKFENLELHANLLRAVQEEGYEHPTPIQRQAIPHVLTGRDLLGCAQTGTGKTAAFALPTLHRLLTSATHVPHAPAAAPRRPQGPSISAHGPRPAARPGPRRPIRALVLAPTRELAGQIGESFEVYGRHSGLKQTVIFGGVGQGRQVLALQQGVDILVATPGRLLDLMQQGHIRLSNIEVLILDEADQMLDMGFLPDLRRIVAQVPRDRQTLMFSATMPVEIRRLAEQWLRNPVSVEVAPVSTPAERVRQSVFHVESRDKPHLLAHYLRSEATGRTLVFTRTKHGADKVVRVLEKSGIRAAAIHGNKSQNARLRVLAEFKSQRPPVLVATDIAARGLDIDQISHVINYDVPNVAETYVHRIGRTGRAGAEGIAVSLCGRDEREFLRQIERLTRLKIPVVAHDLPPRDPADEPAPPARSAPHQAGRQASGRQASGRQTSGRQASGRPSSGHPASRPAAPPSGRSKHRRRYSSRV